MKIKINLFALTGFGNEALKQLLKYDNVDILRIYTRFEFGEFPYYKEEKLSSLAFRNNISVIFVPRVGDWEVKESVDINLCVTFHRILKDKHLKMASLNINIHPSLLPSYRGPTPTNWMIYNKEKICGITAHYLTNDIDKGEIIYQKAYPLCVEKDQQLREFLSKKVKYAIRYIILNYPNYKIIKSKYPSSYYPFFNKK